MYFGIILKDMHELNAQNLFFRLKKLLKNQTFLRIEKRPVLNQVLLVFQRKEIRRKRMTQRCILKIKLLIYCCPNSTFQINSSDILDGTYYLFLHGFEVSQ